MFEIFLSYTYVPNKNNPIEYTNNFIHKVILGSFPSITQILANAIDK